MRHRPHFGRKGEDLKLNRKGNIAGGNPKKSSSNKGVIKEFDETEIVISPENQSFLRLKRILLAASVGILSFSILGLVAYILRGQ